MSTEKKKLSSAELKARMMAKAEASIDKLLEERSPEEEITLTEIEELALRVAKEVQQDITQNLIHASESAEVKQKCVCPQCGRRCHYKGPRERDVVSTSGDVKLKRDYYYCPDCHQGFFPPG